MGAYQEHVGVYCSEKHSFLLLLCRIFLVTEKDTEMILMIYVAVRFAALFFVAVAAEFKVVRFMSSHANVYLVRRPLLAMLLRLQLRILEKRLRTMFLNYVYGD